MRSVFYPDRAGVGRDGRVAGRPAAPRWCCSPGRWAGSSCACSPSSGSSAAPRERPARDDERRDGDTGDARARSSAAMWRRQQPYWHAVFAIVWAAAVVVTLHRRPRPPRPRALARAARRHRRSRTPCSGAAGDDQPRPALGGGLPASSRGRRCSASSGSTRAPRPGCSTSRCSRSCGRWCRPGGPPIGTVVVVVAFSLVRWAQTDFSAGALTEILISGTISMGLSLSLGLFINRIVGEAESRAETIDELRATQARLAAAERDRGVHEERERISREIHDTLAQGFTSVVALSRAAAGRAGPRRHRRGRRAARAHRAHGIRQPRRGPADRRRADPRPPPVAHPR